MKKKWTMRAGALALGITMLAGAAAVMPANSANWLPGSAYASSATEADKTMTVTYTDGVEDEVVFDDVVWTGFRKGSSTPGFKGTPMRDGYVFDGWSPELADTVEGDTVYTAKWVPVEKFKVTYTDGIPNEEVFKDQVFADVVKDSRTPVFDGAPARAGYVFVGWNPSVDDTVTEDVVYEAVWEAKEGPYKVTYNDGIPDKEIFPDKIFKGLKLDDVTPGFNGTPKRDGYEFVGWNPKVPDKVSGDAVYEAVWKEVPRTKYTITYTDGVKDVQLFKNQVYEAEKGMKTPAYNGTPTRNGYTFNGWSPAVAETVTADVTYEATWKEEMLYKVVYTDGVANDVLFADQAYDGLKKGDKTPAFNGTPARSGYKFAGWSPSVMDSVDAAKADGNNVITYTATWTEEKPAATQAPTQNQNNGKGDSMQSDVNKGTAETVKTGAADVVPFAIGFMGIAAAAGGAFFYMRKRKAQ